MTTETSEQTAHSVRMMELLAGFQMSQALFVAAELDLATLLLDGPRTVADLAQTVGADADALTRVIRLLVPYGVFELSSGLVSVTPLGTAAHGTHRAARRAAPSRHAVQPHPREHRPVGTSSRATRPGRNGASGGDRFGVHRGDLTMLAMLGGRERTATEWRDLLGRNGFTLDRVVPTPTPFAIIEATVR